MYTGFVIKVFEEWYGADPVKAPKMLRTFKSLRSLIFFLYYITDAPAFDLHDLVVGLWSGDEEVLKRVGDILERTKFESPRKELAAIAEISS